MYRERERELLKKLIPVSGNNTPFARASALQNRSGSSPAAPDSVSLRLVFPGVVCIHVCIYTYT